MTSPPPFHTYFDNNGNEIIVILDDNDTKVDKEDDELGNLMAVDSLNKFFTLRNAAPVSSLQFFSFFYSILY